MTLLLQIITLIGSVAMLMYGMKVMSEGLQKMAGSKLSNVLGTMTTNRFSGVLTAYYDRDPAEGGKIRVVVAE